MRSDSKMAEGQQTRHPHHRPGSKPKSLDLSSLDLCSSPRWLLLSNIGVRVSSRRWLDATSGWWGRNCVYCNCCSCGEMILLGNPGFGWIDCDILALGLGLSKDLRLVERNNRVSWGAVGWRGRNWVCCSLFDSRALGYRDWKILKVYIDVREGLVRGNQLDWKLNGGVLL